MWHIDLLESQYFSAYCRYWITTKHIFYSNRWGIFKNVDSDLSLISRCTIILFVFQLVTDATVLDVWLKMYKRFPPPLNPAVENTTCTLRTDTDSNVSWYLAHKIMAVIGSVKPIRTNKLPNGSNTCSTIFCEYGKSMFENRVGLLYSWIWIGRETTAR